jgi:hypothetical protein
MNRNAALAFLAAGLFLPLGTITSAHATTTLEVNASTSIALTPFTATAKGSINFETNYGVPTACALGTFQGTLNRGASGGAGTHIGTIQTLLFDDCLSTSLMIESYFTQKNSNANWNIHTTEVPAKGQRYVGIEIRNISMSWLDPRPVGSHIVAGNLAGTIPGILDTVKNSVIIDSPEVLTIDALDRWATKGNSHETTMGGEIWDGDLMNMQAEFNLNVDVEIV